MWSSELSHCLQCQQPMSESCLESQLLYFGFRSLLMCLGKKGKMAAMAGGGWGGV